MTPRIPLIALLAALRLPLETDATASFGCRNSLISDAWREKVLKIHNDDRRTLAKGDQQGEAAKLPAAQDMNQLTWDCNIEEMAQNAAKTCPENPAIPPDYGSANQKDAITNGCDANTMTESVLKKWWEDGAKKQTNQESKVNNKIFAQMAYQKTNAFACTYQTCTTNFYMLCFYNLDGSAGAPKNLYTKVDPAVAAQKVCGACDGGVACINGLCQPKFTLAENLNPKCAVDADSKLMTNDLRNMALDMNNYYRRVLATGWAKDAKGPGGYAPRAKAMPELKYNCNYEKTIMATIKNCAGTPSAAAADEKQNFKKVNGIDKPRDAVLEETITEWWSALATKGVEDNKYKVAMEGTDLGLYANMATDKATEVGCGVQICVPQGNTLVQCGYKINPFLNEGDKIYEEGAPCECGAGKTCSSLGGLCVTP